MAPRRKALLVLALPSLVVSALADPVGAAGGDLDPAFGGNGKVTTNFPGGGDGASGVAIQEDGKIVAAGGAGGRFAVARYRKDGSLDPSFSGNGKVTTSFPGIREGAAAVAIQEDGKIVAAGGMATGTGGRFALARYNTNGTLDPTFGGDGKVTANFTAGGDFAAGVAIQANGKIVAAGSANWNARFAVARYRKDGALDPAFSGNGKVTTNFTPGEDGAFSVAVQADGQIVAAGFIGEGSDEPRFALARYLPDGSLDPAFGGDGRVSTNFVDDALDVARGVAVQADGRIVAAGSAGEDSGNSRFGLARYEVDGALDPSFGGDGRVTTNFIAGVDNFDLAEAVAIQANGNIVAAGRDGSPVGRFALARYLAE
ncbi:MAG: delta-60 repeat domain-containing protein [Actinomycetota bacterium]